MNHTSPDFLDDFQTAPSHNSDSHAFLAWCIVGLFATASALSAIYNAFFQPGSRLSRWKQQLRGQARGTAVNLMHTVTQRRQQQQRHQATSPPNAWLRDQAPHTPLHQTLRQQSAGYRVPLEHEDDAGHGQQQQPHEGWSPELLRSCKPEHVIASPQGLKSTPEFDNYVKGKRLLWESSAEHKLKIYKSLRCVDPDGFQRLFTRQDIKEYDEVQPSKLLSAAEYLLSSITTLTLLALPLSSAWAKHQLAFAFLWVSAKFFACMHGSTSLYAYMFGIYGTFVFVRVEPEIFRFNGVYRMIYYYCGCSSDYGGVVAMEVS
eukprot:jgi/Chrzof1/10853/Cz05g14170.t1